MSEDIKRYKEKDADLALAIDIAQTIKTLGGNAYYVGGYVRDALMDIPNKDIDIEVHGLEAEKLKKILAEYGEVDEVGAKFGVYRIKGYDLDIALPRKEIAVGKGHKDFEVFVDPFLGTKEAAVRRDFTVNALMKDVLTGEIVDHFHGMEHLKEKILVEVNAPSFVEDPLRLFRGAQFAARFQFSVSEETRKLCQMMNVTTLAKERVLGEMEKALLKAGKPSIFFEELRYMDQLKVWFPELVDLIGIAQSKKYHQEGDVWVHTMMVLDEAAKRRDKVEEPLGFMLSALCHDFGKIVATEVIDGQIHAYGHEVKGLSLVSDFIKRLTSKKDILDYVLNMVKYHMKPHVIGQARSKVRTTNHLFDDSVEPYALIQLAECDSIASVREIPQPSNEAFLLERLDVYKEMMARPYVMGRDLIEAGLKPDKNFTDILAHAHKLRLAGVEKETALKDILAYARKKGY